jgi:hypothetical protein
MPFHHVNGIFEINRLGADYNDERLENYEILEWTESQNAVFQKTEVGKPNYRPQAELSL